MVASKQSAVVRVPRFLARHFVRDEVASWNRTLGSAGSAAAAIYEIANVGLSWQLALQSQLLFESCTPPAAFGLEMYAR